MADLATLVLFPGMAADSRLFAPQRALPFPVVAIDWPSPQAGEALPAYARRVAGGIDWPTRFVIGGVSFGGMVAAELAAAAESDPPAIPRPLGLVLIASALTGRAVPGAYRFVNALTRAVPDQLISFSAGFSRQFLNVFGHLGSDDRELMADMLRQTSVTDIRCWADMIMHWDGPAPSGCPRLWIHGEQDLVIPLAQVRRAGFEPDVIVPGGGHLLSYTDPASVNAPIEAFVRRVSAA